MKKIIAFLFILVATVSTAQPVKAENVYTGPTSLIYVSPWDLRTGNYPDSVNRESVRRWNNWVNMLKQNKARVQGNYKMYGYQQAAQRFGNGGSLNPIAPGTVQRVLNAPIMPVRNQPTHQPLTYSQKYGNGGNDYTPVYINGVEHVKVDGRFVPVTCP